MAETKTEVRTHENLIEALAAAQAEFPEIKKDKTANIQMRGGGKYSYSYASLDAVLTATRPILASHGIAISWRFQVGGDGNAVITRLLFPGDEPLESPIPVYSEGDMQSLGSAITYAKRYGLTGLIGVTAEEDDDGSSAGQPPDRARSGKTKSGPSTEPVGNASLPVKPAAPLTLDTWRAKIAEKQTPEEMMAFITNCAGYEPLTSNVELCGQVFDAISAAIKSRNWNEEARNLVTQHLLTRHKAVDLEQQSKETFGNEAEKTAD